VSASLELITQDELTTPDRTADANLIGITAGVISCQKMHLYVPADVVNMSIKMPRKYGMNIVKIINQNQKAILRYVSVVVAVELSDNSPA